MWGGTGENRGRGNFNQDVLYEKNNLFSIMKKKRRKEGMGSDLGADPDSETTALISREDNGPREVHTFSSSICLY